MHVAVVGSGPAGVACAKALVRRGVRVTVLDVGETLEPERQAAVERLRRRPPGEWGGPDLQTIVQDPTREGRAIPRKLVFGSEFHFARNRPVAPMTEAPGVEAAPTFARGGYSVAWGGAMLPAADCDTSDWPVGRAELAAAYGRVLADLPFSARNDALAEAFPLFRRETGALELPHQASALLADLERVPAGGDLAYGRARLAVRLQPDGKRGGCIYCGLCLSGCVPGAIHNLADDLDALAHRGALEYRGGVYVMQLEEVGAAVRVTSLRNGAAASELFDRVFVGAGAVSSTRLMLQSLGQYDRPVLLKDSQRFVVPMFRWQRLPLQWPAINSLAALFIELKDPAISDHWIHMQVSAVNDFVLAGLGLSPTAAGRGWRDRLLAPAVERLMIGWAGLHSDHSSAVSVTLRPARGGSPATLSLEPVVNPRTAGTVRRAARTLARIGLRFRTGVLFPAVRLSPIGGGNHVGGSMPMRRSPRDPMETDPLGRPAGWRRVHVVDGSIMPSLPATTLALPIMANADRIATEAPLDGGGG